MGAAEALGGARKDRFGCSRRVGPHVAVPHSKDRPAFAAQPFVAHFVAFGFRMLPAVDLDYEPRRATGEIGDVRADRQLPRKLGPVAREEVPDLAFLGRCVRPQGTGAFGDLDFYAP